MTQRAQFLKTSLTGGTTDALDGIVGNARGITSDTTNIGIQEHDVALTIYGNNIYIHEYQIGVSPWTESSPDVIIPDVASTSGSAWILLGVFGESLNVRGDITVSGTVDGIDIGTDVAANTSARHAQSHTIASHSDTTATGTELNTLTDDSMADALHRHSELSASDGSLNPAFSVGTNGHLSNTSDYTGVVTLLQDSSSNTTPALKIIGSSGDPTNYHFTVVPNLSTSVNYLIKVKNAGPEVTAIKVLGTGDISIPTGSLGIGKDPTGQFEISTDDAIKPSTNTWTIFSGKELKENTELANLDLCYENFKKAKLKRYRYKDDCYSDIEINDRHMLGFIADDIELINPKSVKDVKFIKQPEEVEETVVQEEIKDKDGKITQPLKTEKKIIKEEISVQTKSLNNDQNIMNMFGTVAKLQMMVEGLQDRIDVLESENKGLQDTKENS